MAARSAAARAADDATPRRATASDAAAIARLHRIVRAACLPYLPDLHSPEEDLAFFRDRVLPESCVWCTEACLPEAASHPCALTGFIAFREGWVDHLYIHPDWHARGIGSRLLGLAQAAEPTLQLWVFQKNLPALRFYIARGFEVVETTDGSRNEEGEPDARMVWRRDDPA